MGRSGFFVVAALALKLFIPQPLKAPREQPPPRSPPPTRRHSECYLHEVFSAAAPTRLQSETLRGQSEGRGERKHRGGESLLCFTSAKQQRSKNKPKTKIRCRKGITDVWFLSFGGWNGATRRGRARLCGGEHREEAQQKGLSLALWRTFVTERRGTSPIWLCFDGLYFSHPNYWRCADGAMLSGYCCVK